MAQPHSRTQLRGIFVGLFLVFAISVSDLAAQEVITVCSASAGYPQQDGRLEGDIKGGTLTVVRDAAGTYDIIAMDVIATFSARGDGARVVKLDGADDFRFTLLVVYPQALTEVYQFNLDQRGRGTLSWASVRDQTDPIGVTKGTATCSK
jgi:hypothetical protein